MTMQVQASPRYLRASVARPEPLVVLSVRPLAEVWLVREADSSTGEVYDRRHVAVARARHLLRRRGGGRLRILRRDGSVERELDTRSYERFHSRTVFPPV